MKCPLLVVEDIRCHDNQLTDTSDCLKEECAWWGTWTTAQSDEETGCCFPIIASLLATIRYKMPHEEQFRR